MHEPNDKIVARLEQNLDDVKADAQELARRSERQVGSRQRPGTYADVELPLKIVELPSHITMVMADEHDHQYISVLFADGVIRTYLCAEWLTIGDHTIRAVRQRTADRTAFRRGDIEIELADGTVRTYLPYEGTIWFPDAKRMYAAAHDGTQARVQVSYVARMFERGELTNPIPDQVSANDLRRDAKPHHMLHALAAMLKHEQDRNAERVDRDVLDRWRERITDLEDDVTSARAATRIVRAGRDKIAAQLGIVVDPDAPVPVPVGAILGAIRELTTERDTLKQQLADVHAQTHERITELEQLVAARDATTALTATGTDPEAAASTMRDALRIDIQSYGDAGVPRHAVVDQVRRIREAAAELERIARSAESTPDASEGAK